MSIPLQFASLYDGQEVFVLFDYNSKGAFQLVKDLTTVKQGKATNVQNRSGKCLTGERQILNRWAEYCYELYNYKANGDLSVLDCPHIDTEDVHPILYPSQRSAGCSTIIEKREVSWSHQHPGRTAATCCSARTTKQSALSATLAKSC